MEINAFFDANGISPESINKYIISERTKNADMKRTVHELQEYARTTCDELFVSETELLITNLEYCSGLMDYLSKATLDIYGQEIWDKIFGGAEMPEAGWTLEEMNAFTYETEQKFKSAVPENGFGYTLSKGNSWVRTFGSNEHKSLTLKDVDDIVEKHNVEFINLLRNHHESGNVFFNQIIDDSVIKEYESGKWDCRRDGRVIKCTKIPFLMRRYLKETNSNMKRYYACHCPWARKSILSKKPVTKEFCHCSLSYEKRGLEEAFGRELTGRVVDTVLSDGVSTCTFEIKIPDDII